MSRGILQITQRAANLVSELVLGFRPPCGRRFHMLPHHRVGVVVRRASGGRKDKRNSRRWHESTGSRHAMRRSTIDDENDRALCAGDKTIEAFDEDSGADAAAFCGSEPRVATRIDRRNQAHGVAGATRLNDRRCAACASSAPRREIGTDLRGDGDAGFFPARQGLNPREFW